MCIYIYIYKLYIYIYNTYIIPQLDVQIHRLLFHITERGARPVTNFLRNLSALSNWHSVYTSAIAFIVSLRFIPVYHIVCQ